jgi:hypothetical protein
LEAIAMPRLKGRLFVLEDDPPPTRPRWFCDWDGNAAPGFDDLDQAVAWGLARARGVVVRTLKGAFYLAGERPSDWGQDIEFSPWPPSPLDRRKIDTDYEEAMAAGYDDEAAWQFYEQDRDRWLAEHAPDLVGRTPVHECIIEDTDGDPFIHFEELSATGEVCGARSQAGTYAFGDCRAAIANASGLRPDDPWVEAVMVALDRDRAWTHRGRRSRLHVTRGRGEMFHATAARNRQSITQHGLDWQRMEEVPGIAGSRQPELPAVFLCESAGEVQFFTDMSRLATDVWAVRVDGLWLENGPDGWVILPEPVPPERLRLVETDIPPGRLGQPR